jgi:hypothetical protein
MRESLSEASFELNRLTQPSERDLISITRLFEPHIQGVCRKPEGNIPLGKCRRRSKDNIKVYIQDGKAWSGLWLVMLISDEVL